MGSSSSRVFPIRNSRRLCGVSATRFTSQLSTTSVEIYHGGHNLIETRAPIRAMSFASWGGKPYLVAAYTCTPLVIMPLDELKNGAHVRGKTVAELGYGNTPADMIAYTKTEQGKKKTFCCW